MTTPLCHEKPEVLKALLEEIDATDANLFPPSGEIDENEEVVGTCTDYMMKLYSLARLCGREEDQAGIDLRYSSGGEAVTGPIKVRMDEMKQKREILLSLFWYISQKEFGLMGREGTVGIRENWKITFTKECNCAVHRILGLLEDSD